MRLNSGSPVAVTNAQVIGPSNAELSWEEVVMEIDANTFFLTGAKYILRSYGRDSGIPLLNEKSIRRHRGFAA
ncbi:hypothetical protein [Pedobacter sp. BAL39]|uniref:hypothetical protein n=1 Tax=Pedobacter sp. BAL39 TaxID=391596 RepID=UPI0012FC744B|nr:hypothetical protein [Pedobacter sp. BAL39]